MSGLTAERRFQGLGAGECMWKEYEGAQLGTREQVTKAESHIDSNWYHLRYELDKI